MKPLDIILIAVVAIYFVFAVVYIALKAKRGGLCSCCKNDHCSKCKGQCTKAQEDERVDDCNSNCNYNYNCNTNGNTDRNTNDNNAVSNINGVTDINNIDNIIDSYDSNNDSIT